MLRCFTINISFRTYNITLAIKTYRNFYAIRGARIWHRHMFDKPFGLTSALCQMICQYVSRNIKIFIDSWAMHQARPATFRNIMTDVCTFSLMVEHLSPAK